MPVFDVTGKLVVNQRAREWCKLAYPGHPKGCPNYGKLKECPPAVKPVGEVFDLSRMHWFVTVEFDLEAQTKRMAELHKNWTQKQCRNLLYWQKGVNADLEVEVREFINFAQLAFTLKPEAMGVNVIQTARNLGVPIETKPVKKVFKIALVGYPRRNVNA